MKVQEIKRGSNFGRWTVVKSLPRRKGKIYFLCQCKCGTKKPVNSSNLLSGKTTSCGCLHREIISTHGFSKMPEFWAWKEMIRRCYSPQSDSYQYYGARGIRVCASWKRSFKNFLADMGLKTDRALSLERADTNGNYTPKNCRWASNHEQHRNRTDNRFITFKGSRRTITDWAFDLGITAKAISVRISNGWPLERALTLPRMH